MLKPLTEQGIRSRAKRHQCVEILGVSNIFEQIDRGEYGRNELYRLLPGQPLRRQARAVLRRGQ